MTCFIRIFVRKAGVKLNRTTSIFYYLYGWKINKSAKSVSFLTARSKHMVRSQMLPVLSSVLARETKGKSWDTTGLKVYKRLSESPVCKQKFV
jgi:hypothetical protein